jgi:hypothetical protein
MSLAKQEKGPSTNALAPCYAKKVDVEVLRAQPDPHLMELVW